MIYIYRHTYIHIYTAYNCYLIYDLNIQEILCMINNTYGDLSKYWRLTHEIMVPELPLYKSPDCQ